MPEMIERLIPFLFISLILSACSTSEEKRMEAIQSLLSEEIEKTAHIEILDISYDSVYSNQLNINTLNGIQEIILLRDSIVQELNNFKTQYADENCRVWLKDTSNDLRTSFESIGNKTDHMYSLINELSIKCNSDSRIGQSQTSVVVKYKSNGKIRYGLFIFSDNETITEYKILSLEEYSSIEEFINYAKIDATKYIPIFENLGVDIVPEDEDPTKTREEREESKAQQRNLTGNQREQNLVLEKAQSKTPIISRTYYDFTIGKSQYSSTINSVRNKGFEIMQYPIGNKIKMFACVKKFKWNNINWDELDLYFKDYILVGIAFAIACNSETKAKHYLERVSNIYKERYKQVITDSSPDYLYFDDGKTAMEVYGGTVTMYLRICETDVADDL